MSSKDTGSGPAKSQNQGQEKIKGTDKFLPKSKTAQNKAGQQPTKQIRRKISDLSDTSIESMDLSVIQNQLDIMQETMIRKEDLETIIKSTITQTMNKMEERIIETVKIKVEEKTRDLQDQINSLTFENDRLKEEHAKKDKEYSQKLEELEERFKKTDEMSIEANRRANRNEQYSRKNNIKIYGIKEEGQETQMLLTEKVQDILKKENVELQKEEIIAIHRLPTKPGQTRPVIIKTINNTVKTAVMKKRKEMREAGHRIADDVTTMNSGLINRLTLHSKMRAAWFFNGSVYGETFTGERVKFDVYDNIDETLQKFHEMKEMNRQRRSDGSRAPRS